MIYSKMVAPILQRNQLEIQGTGPRHPPPHWKPKPSWQLQGIRHPRCYTQHLCFLELQPALPSPLERSRKVRDYIWKLWLGRYKRLIMMFLFHLDICDIHPTGMRSSTSHGRNCDSHPVLQAYPADLAFRNSKEHDQQCWLLLRFML